MYYFGAFVVWCPDTTDVVLVPVLTNIVFTDNSETFSKLIYIYIN